MSTIANFRNNKRVLLPWLALLTVWIFWGSTYLGIRAAVETIPPLLMAGFRFLLAGAVMYAVVAPKHARGENRPTLVQLRSSLIIGAVLLVGGNGLLSVGETGLESGLAALIVATVPVWMVLINAVVTRTRITKSMVLALVLGTIGVGLLMGGPGSGAINVAKAIIVLIASVFWAAGSVYSRTAPLPSNPLVVTSLQMLAGGLLLIIAGAATGEFGRLDLRAITANSLIGFFWLVLAGSMLAFSAYVYANANLPNDTVATYAYVNPVVAVILGTLIGQEHITLNLVLGGAVIVSAVALIVGGRARPRPADVEPGETETLDAPEKEQPRAESLQSTGAVRDQ